MPAMLFISVLKEISRFGGRPCRIPSSHSTLPAFSQGPFSRQWLTTPRQSKRMLALHIASNEHDDPRSNAVKQSHFVCHRVLLAVKGISRSHPLLRCRASVAAHLKSILAIIPLSSWL